MYQQVRDLEGIAKDKNTVIVRVVTKDRPFPPPRLFDVTTLDVRCWPCCPASVDENTGVWKRGFRQEGTRPLSPMIVGLHFHFYTLLHR